MIVLAIFIGIYCVLIGLLIIGFDRMPYYKFQEQKAQTGFSVIIPFRNEAAHLNDLLKSIQELNYPNEWVEFILVDDASSDQSQEIINSYTIKNLRSIQNKRFSGSPKKDAITTAISEAKHSWIITTDADCTFPKNWLAVYNQYLIENKCNMLVAPVSYHKNKGFFKEFQFVDFLSLQGATVGGFGWQKPFLCNGANLVYKKDVFEQLNGFDTNNTIASGDDFFLLESFLTQDKVKVHYLKSREALVKTNAVDSLKQLINQRVRWAAKSTHYNLVEAKIIGLFVLLANASLLTLPFFILSDLIAMKVSLVLFLCKCSIDLILLFKTAQMMEQKIDFPSYVLSCFLYPFFSCYVVLRATLGNYQWKDRVFKK
ncbi:glycosyl transferase [Polaribacter pacificus]|uniref:Glycosyl transferase n=1 Tax=Polaribacter pacificus TaxID=1775173 RepID=A0A917HXD3_9FLAO|nr:glycosyltransferase [Polaribacter pacificus]GGG96479.1 glycosyl transferase [Polaribacter pacificus]